VVGLGGQVRISELQGGRVRVDAGNRPDARLRGCVALAELDGVVVRARLRGTLDRLAGGEPLRFESCGDPRRLGPGDHHLRSAPGWLVDLLRLASGGRRGGPGDRRGGPTEDRGPPGGPGWAAAPDLPAAPRVTVTSSGAARTELAAEPAAAPYYLVAGQGYDRRWRATMDGQPLGPPELLDGWSIGWRISDPRPHRFVVEFGPSDRPPPPWSPPWPPWPWWRPCWPGTGGGDERALAGPAGDGGAAGAARRPGRAARRAGPGRLRRRPIAVPAGAAGRVGGPVGRRPAGRPGPGLPTRATLGPDLAVGNPVAHVLAGTGLALLVLGVLRDVRAGRPAADPPSPPADPAGERALVLRRPDRPGDGLAP
jgi:hypothetical protein